jgi:hypothetical protein
MTPLWTTWRHGAAVDGGSVELWHVAFRQNGGYLFDPQGDLRRWRMDPCRRRC